jgi:hypothetical protein
VDAQPGRALSCARARARARSVDPVHQLCLRVCMYSFPHIFVEDDTRMSAQTFDCNVTGAFANHGVLFFDNRRRNAPDHVRTNPV